MTQEELDAMMAEGIDLDSVETKENEELHKQQDKIDGHGHKQYKDEHLVTQLTDVTFDSEKKATEIFDNLDKVLAKVDEIEGNDQAAEDIRNIIFETMSIMQYQDIHRQKIERVINTIREMSNMMINVLDSVDERKFAPSAKHISGDKDTEDLVDTDEIEKLIAQMAK